MKTILTTADAETISVSDKDTAKTLHAKVEEQLYAGVAHFFFTKKNGSTREAYGTLNKDLLTAILGEQEPKEEATEPISVPVVQRYYDLNAKAFRAYTIANLVALF